MELIYDELTKNYGDINYIRHRAIITPKNKIADDINNYILSLIPNESKTYYSYDKIVGS